MTELLQAADWCRVSDTELASALMRNEPAAARAAWLRFEPLVRKVARRVLGPGCDLEDIVQEVFMRFFGGVSGLRDPSALRAFFLSVTSRTLGYELRLQKQRDRQAVRLKRGLVGAEAGLECPSLDAVAGSKRAFANLQVLLHRFNARQRRAFLLFWVDGLTALEVAQALGVSIPTARRAYLRARRRLDLWAERDAQLSAYSRVSSGGSRSKQLRPRAGATIATSASRPWQVAWTAGARAQRPTR
jgi:RNA polymerase sigma factor (sigma-70 family)